MDLEVTRGERLALIGESGVGKSTLLYLLSGLDSPTAGTISYNSRALSGLADSELADFRNREIGFVWQSHNLLPEFTAQENVMMPLLVRGVPPSRGSIRLDGETRGSGAGRPGVASGGGAFRRRTAAGGSGARAGREAFGFAGRRTYRKFRLQNRRNDFRSVNSFTALARAYVSFSDAQQFLCAAL